MYIERDVFLFHLTYVRSGHISFGVIEREISFTVSGMVFFSRDFFFFFETRSGRFFECTSSYSFFFVLFEVKVKRVFFFKV